MPGDTCDVCGSGSIGVAASPLGPISHAYCMDCITSNREPLSTLIGALIGTIEDGRFAVHDWIRPYIEETLDHYDKTEAWLLAEVARSTAEYEKATR